MAQPWPGSGTVIVDCGKITATGRETLTWDKGRRGGEHEARGNRAAKDSA